MSVKKISNEEIKSLFKNYLTTRQIIGKDAVFSDVVLNVLITFLKSSNVAKDAIEKVASENTDIADLSKDIDELNVVIIKTFIYTARKMKECNGKDVYVSVKDCKDIIIRMLNTTIDKEPDVEVDIDKYVKHMAVEGAIYRLYEDYKNMISYIVRYENRRKMSNLLRC